MQAYTQCKGNLKIIQWTKVSPRPVYLDIKLTNALNFIYSRQHTAVAILSFE